MRPRAPRIHRPVYVVPAIQSIQHTTPSRVLYCSFRSTRLVWFVSFIKGRALLAGRPDAWGVVSLVLSMCGVGGVCDVLAGRWNVVLMGHGTDAAVGRGVAQRRGAEDIVCSRGTRRRRRRSHRGLSSLAWCAVLCCAVGRLDGYPDGAISEPHGNRFALLLLLNRGRHRSYPDEGTSTRAEPTADAYSRFEPLTGLLFLNWLGVLRNLGAMCDSTLVSP